MKINVTLDIISGALPRNANRGPIADAISTALGLDIAERRVSVVPGGWMRFYASNFTDSVWHYVPSLTQFIEDFDAGLPVEPFDFELGIHDEMITTIGGGGRRYQSAADKAWTERTLARLELVAC
jgi:hypothetical protein